MLRCSYRERLGRKCARGLGTRLALNRDLDGQVVVQAERVRRIVAVDEVKAKLTLDELFIRY